MQQRGPVALVMPFKDEAERLPAVLASIAAQRYDVGRLRLIALGPDEAAQLEVPW